MECIAHDRTVTLGAPTGRQLVSASEAAENTWAHVQSYAECALGKASDATQLKYVRGCAGSIGFASGQLPRARIEAFAREMLGLIRSDRFAQWGSEQVISNLMAGASSGTLVLPAETPLFWAPGLKVEQPALIHFFGTYRCPQGMYLRQSMRVIRELDALH